MTVEEEAALKIGLQRAIAGAIQRWRIDNATRLKAAPLSDDFWIRIGRTAIRAATLPWPPPIIP